MPEILIDAKGLQAHQHLNRTLREGLQRDRLTTFVECIKRLGAVDFSQSTIDAHELAHVNLLVITTRRPVCPFEDEEIRSVHDFVADGGSLLLMTNHSKVLGRPKMGHFTEQDGRLAAAFQIRILKACFKSLSEGKHTSIQNAGDDVHPVLLDSSGSRVVHSVEINNCSGISAQSEKGRPILYLASDMIDIGPNELSPRGEAFAWSIDSYGRGEGRVIVIGDSGFIGEPNLGGSGPGLIDKAQNKLFIQRTVEWLLHRD